MKKLLLVSVFALIAFNTQAMEGSNPYLLYYIAYTMDHNYLPECWYTMAQPIWQEYSEPINSTHFAFNHPIMMQETTPQYLIDAQNEEDAALAIVELSRTCKKRSIPAIIITPPANTIPVAKTKPRKKNNLLTVPLRSKNGRFANKPQQPIRYLSINKT